MVATPADVTKKTDSLESMPQGLGSDAQARAVGSLATPPTWHPPTTFSPRTTGDGFAADGTDAVC
jgi:hypothetical protein